MEGTLSQLALNLAVATFMVAITTLTHFFGLLLLTRVMSGAHTRLRPFSTLGFGDLTLSVRWRVLGAIEAVNGLVLIAWSTAFLMSVTSRLRLLEHEWLEHER